MNDPYQVLGVSPSASDDEVKAAYRALAKKYHPDNYANNPLADLAAEKMKEINEAYDTVQKMRASGGGASGGYSSSSYGGSSSSYSGSSSGQYAQIRQMINANRIPEAQQMLDHIPLNERNAEWHFLTGSVMYKKGWINEAYTNFQAAYRNEPGNPEYRQAVEQVSRQMNGFGGYGGFGGYNAGQPGQCSGCDVCSGLLCADCLCNGCGGGAGC